jgi:hypothetical protein
MKILTISNFQAVGFGVAMAGVISRYALSSGSFPESIISLANDVGLRLKYIELLLMVQTCIGGVIVFVASLLSYVNKNQRSGK